MGVNYPNSDIGPGKGLFIKVHIGWHDGDDLRFTLSDGGKQEFDADDAGFSTFRAEVGKGLSNFKTWVASYCTGFGTACDNASNPTNAWNIAWATAKLLMTPTGNDVWWIFHHGSTLNWYEMDSAGQSTFKTETEASLQRFKDWVALYVPDFAADCDADSDSATAWANAWAAAKKLVAPPY